MQNCLRGYLIIDLLAEFNARLALELVLETNKPVFFTLVFSFFIIFRGVSPGGAVIIVVPMLVLSFMIIMLATEATNVKASSDAVKRQLVRLDMSRFTAVTRDKVLIIAL